MHCSKDRSGGGFKTLLFGMLAGLIIGILFAPKPGSETMSQVSDKVVRKLPV